MSAISTAGLLDEAGNFKVLPAGVVIGRPKPALTKAIPLVKVRAPKAVKVESGGRAAATKVPFGHVRISTYPKHMAGMDPAGFMT